MGSQQGGDQTLDFLKKMPKWPYQDGKTWVEVAVVVLIYGTILAVLLDRLLYYQELAEKASMEYVATVLRSELRIKMGELIIQNREADIPALAHQNPITWLEKQPQSYCGELEHEADGEVTGCWYFIRDGKILTYLVNNGGNFLPDDQGQKRISYRLNLLKGPQVTPTIELQLLEPYYWFSNPQ